MERRIENGFYVRRLPDGRVRLRVTVEDADHSPTYRSVVMSVVSWLELAKWVDEDDGSR